MLSKWPPSVKHSSRWFGHNQERLYNVKITTTSAYPAKLLYPAKPNQWSCNFIGCSAGIPRANLGTSGHPVLQILVTIETRTILQLTIYLIHLHMQDNNSLTNLIVRVCISTSTAQYCTRGLISNSSYFLLAVTPVR